MAGIKIMTPSFADLKRYMRHYLETLTPSESPTKVAENDNPDKRSIWIDIDSPQYVIQFILWETGETALMVGEVATGEVLVEENRLVLSPADLKSRLDSAFKWTNPQQRA